MKFEVLSVKSLDRQGLITEVNKYYNGTVEYKEGFAFVNYLGLFDKDGDETTLLLKDKYCWGGCPYEYIDSSDYMEECTEEIKKRINNT